MARGPQKWFTAAALAALLAGCADQPTEPEVSLDRADSGSTLAFQPSGDESPAAAAKALGSQLGQPVPAAVIVAHNGLEWVWASPCTPNGCSGGIDVGHDGFVFATDAQWALRPSPSAFRNPDKCASPWFERRFDHCDWGDAFNGYYGSSADWSVGPNGGNRHPNAETWLVRGAVVVNQPPTASAGADQEVECAGAATDVTLDGSGSSDPDGDALIYTWSEGGSPIASGVSPTVSLGDGAHTITLTVDDGNGHTASDDVVVTIVDTTPPTASLSLDTASLWPPNHQMVSIGAGISATDICDGDLALGLSVTSNEPVDGTGDGDTAPDWDVVDNGDGTFSLALRAERKGNGSGRVYTVTLTATDDAGHSSSASATVVVPKSQGRK